MDEGKGKCLKERQAVDVGGSVSRARCRTRLTRVAPPQLALSIVATSVFDAAGRTIDRSSSPVDLLPNRQAVSAQAKEPKTHSV